MSEPILALQAAIRARLVATSAVTALCPANNILDMNQRPNVSPVILIGEGQTLPGDDLARRNRETYLDFHIWTIEPGTALSKQIAGAVRDCLEDTVWTGLVSGLAIADMRIAMTRFMRDPDGVHAHAVMTICARTLELA